MSDACVILDDRPKHIQPIREEVERAGAVPEVTKKPKQLMRKINQAREHGTLRGILLDNHIDDYDDLSDLGRADVSTDEGTTAGYRIAVEYLIPMIVSGELPELPIGIMSAADVSLVKEEFEASGDDRYAHLFFFKKSDVTSNDEDARAFFNALEDPSIITNRDTGSDEDLNAAYIAVAESFRTRFAITEAEMAAIFSLSETPSYSSRVQQGALSVDSSGWHDMAYILLRVESLLTSLYRNAANPGELGASRLRNHRLMGGRHTGLELLMTGRILRAVEVAEELTMGAEPLRVQATG